MITPLVERAILKGHGTLRAYSLGGGGLCKIDMPIGHFGILLDFIYYPFSSVYLAEDYSLQQEKETFQEIDFYSGANTWKYTHKVFWNGYDQSAGGAANHIVSPVPCPKIDTFIPFKDDLYVQFKVPQIIAGGGAVTNGALTFTQAPQAPESEGNANPFSVKQIQSATGNYYFPATAPDAGLDINLNSYSNIHGGLLETFASYSKGGINKNSYLPMVTCQILIVPEQNRNFL